MNNIFDYPAIGKRIKLYRKQNKLTQQQLAELIDKTESSIRKYEKGLIEIPNIVLIQISDALNIKVWMLLGMDEAEAHNDLKTYLFLGDTDQFDKEESKLGKLLIKAFGESTSKNLATKLDVDTSWWENEEKEIQLSLDDCLKKEGLNDGEIIDVKKYIEFIISKRL